MNVMEYDGLIHEVKEEIVLEGEVFDDHRGQPSKAETRVSLVCGPVLWINGKHKMCAGVATCFDCARRTFDILELDDAYGRGMMDGFYARLKAAGFTA